MRTVVIGAGAGAALGALLASLFVAPAPLLIWNASASAPRGLYRRAEAGGVGRGSWLLVHAPHWAENLAASRGYVPADVALIKHVAGVSGDAICRADTIVTRNGQRVAIALERDSQGRVLPQWHGCLRLQPGQIFLLNPPDHSFDSRYFGPVPQSLVIERIKPLWTF